MLYGLYVSAAGMQAQERRQDILSNNLANSQTTGFKRDLLDIQTRANAVDEDPAMARYRIPVVDHQGGGVFATGGGIDLTQASIKQTGNDKDLALDGPGFFTVQGAKPGEKNLTRDGRFILNRDGTLVTATSNRPVLSSSGTPITLNPSIPVLISSTGQISQAGTPIGQLGLSDVTDPRHLRKLGSNLLTADTPDGLKPVGDSTMVRQGNLEESGVDSVVEMVNMLEGQRAFEANAKMINYQDTTLSQLNTIGRIA